MKKLGLVALVGRKQRRKDERKQAKQRKSAGGRSDTVAPAVAKRKLASESIAALDQSTKSAPKKAKREREKVSKAVPTDPLILRDAQEIAYLESKLGVKKGSGGRSKLAKEFEEDGLGGEFINFLDSLDHLVGSEQSNVDSEAEAYARERDTAVSFC